MVMRIHSSKMFTVECKKCGIKEGMIFRDRLLYCHMSNRLDFSTNVPLFHYYVPSYEVDSNGKTKINVFKPRKGITGDKLPKTCPVCGEKLDYFTYVRQLVTSLFKNIKKN